MRGEIVTQQAGGRSHSFPSGCMREPAATIDATVSERDLPRPLGGFPAFLLILSVYGYAASLVLDWGIHQIFLYAVAAGALARVLRTPEKFTIDQPIAVLLTVVAVLALQGYLAAPDRIDLRFLERLSWSVFAVAGVVMLPGRFANGRRLTHESIVATVAMLYVAAQWIAFSRYSNKFGLFSNLHFLALYCVLTLPILFYFSIVKRGWFKWLFVLLLLGDALLLLKSQSRPGFLALLVGVLAIVPFLARPYRWITVTAVLIIPCLLYLLGIYGFDARINDLLANLIKEERVAIWTETFEMQSASSISEWIFGHGFGQFYLDYQAYSSFHSAVDFSFPHNFLLELLYSHGLIGLIVLVTGYTLFFTKLAMRAARTADPGRRRIGLLLIALTTAHLTHSFFTFPFFSKSTLYPLSLVLGAGFRFLRDSRTDEWT